jgi:hypothetical protein
MFQNGEIVEGTQYHAISSLAHKIGFSGERINGFLDSSGEFLLPKEAAVVAFAADQIKEPVEELSPDDLWPPLMSD